MVCVCRTATLSSTVHCVLTVYCQQLPLLLRVSPEVWNWMKVCHHTLSLLITQMSLPDSVLWQDS